VEWYLGEFTKEAGPPYFAATPVFIDGKADGYLCEGAPIEAALAQRHCPESSDGHIGADYGDEGCCPVCRARHELLVYKTVEVLNKNGIDAKMAI